MKKILFLIATTLLAACNSAASPSAAAPSSNDLSAAIPSSSNSPSADSNMKNSDSITITVGSAKFTAHIEDSETGRAFLAKLPMTLNMSELHGNEKYYYGSAGGYSYTPIGTLTDTTGLAKALGSGKVDVTFSK